MNKKVLLSIGVFIFVLVFLTTISFADNWILDSKSKKLPKDLVQRIELAGGKLVKSWDFLGVAVAEFPDEATARAFETEGLKVMPDVELEWVPPNERVHADHIGDDETYYHYQWHLPVIEADKAWDEGITGAGVRVAVVDTGIWYYHPDLYYNIDFASSATFVPGTTDFMDDRGHGTHVAGIIAAINNDWGSIGVAPNATLIGVKVLNFEGRGMFSWVWAGVIHAVEQNADIINMSLSGYLKKSGEPPDYFARDAAYLMSTWNKVANWAASQGVLLVTSAGNDAINHNHNQNWIRLPAEAGNCIAISATGPVGLQNFDNPASYTSYGTSLVWVAAPGGDFQLYPNPNWWLDMVFSTTVEGWSWMAGTSMAAPCVSGVAALILEKYGPMSVAKLKNHIAQTADDLGKPGRDHYYGRGRINAYKAVMNQKK